MAYQYDPITGNYYDPVLEEMKRVRELEERYERGKNNAFHDIPVNQLLSTNISYGDLVFMISCEHEIKNFGARHDWKRYNKIRDSVLEQLDVKFDEQVEWFHHLLTRKIETE
jgi:hypothetical protein